MAKINYLNDVYYRRSDETVQTAIVDGKKVVFIHYLNGYFSYFSTLEGLMKYLNEGDTSGRIFCSENDEDFGEVADDVLN